MKFQFKLILTAMAVAFISNVLMLALSLPRIHESLFAQVQSKALSIAATAGALVDGDKLARIRTRESESSPEYKELRSRLRLLRDANRREDVQVAYIYTLHPSPMDPSVLLMGVDPEDSIENSSHPGDVYKGVFGTRFLLTEKPIVDERNSSDQWGEWLSAYAPVKDGSGRTVSMLGIDLKYGDVRKITTEAIIKISLLSFAASAMIAIILALLLSRAVARPLKQLHSAMKAVEGGNTAIRISPRGKDEFAEIASTFNQMSEGLRQRENLKSAFARYVSSHIMEKALSQGPVALEGERRKITVLFADIRNFTRLSENLPPKPWSRSSMNTSRKWSR